MILAAAAAEASADTFTGLMDHVGQGFEALGAAILAVGFIWSFVFAAVAMRRSGWTAKTYLVHTVKGSSPGPGASSLRTP